MALVLLFSTKYIFKTFFNPKFVLQWMCVELQDIFYPPNSDKQADNQQFLQEFQSPTDSSKKTEWNIQTVTHTQQHTGISFTANRSPP